MNLTIIVAAVAAVAIVLIALGIATSGSGSGITARLERYASNAPEAKTAGAGGLSEALSQSAALANLNRVVEARDFGANLSRELARADLKLKVSEYLAIWVGCIVGVPVL